MSGLSVTFWGVRGTVPSPGAATSRYGGNTSCVEVRAGAERLVFDMGSGLRALGEKLAKRPGARATFFLSHYHLDHILGLPFFAPAYKSDSRFVVHGPTRDGVTVRDVLAGEMRAPYFPVELAALPASFDFREVKSGDRLAVGRAVVSARELWHPGGALGYRVDHDGASVVYATDFEHGQGGDDALVELCADADLLVFDATFSPREYRSHRGWGHSTWEAGVRLAKRANVGRFVLFHHDPAHDDRAVDALLAAARARFPNCEAAREGRTVVLPGRSARTQRPSVAARRTRG